MLGLARLPLLRLLLPRASGKRFSSLLECNCLARPARELHHLGRKKLASDLIGKSEAGFLAGRLVSAQAP
jgi:hypothetical protein